MRGKELYIRIGASAAAATLCAFAIFGIRRRYLRLVQLKQLQQQQAQALPTSTAARPTQPVVGKPVVPKPVGENLADLDEVSEIKQPTNQVFEVGAFVRFTGLKSKPELNGKRGTVKSFDSVKGRLNIKLPDGRTLQVRRHSHPTFFWQAHHRNTCRTDICSFCASLHSNADTQIKPDNLTAATVQPYEMTVQELMALCMGSHAALTPAHAARVVELLHSTQQPVEAGCLLRCVCCIAWHVMHIKHKKSGSKRIFQISDATNGKGFVLCSEPSMISVLQQNNKAPSGSAHCTETLTGRSIFSQSTLDGLGFVNLDPVIGPTAETSRFTVLPQAYFGPLIHMSEALHVERGLSAIARWNGAATAADAFATKTFFHVPEEAAVAADAFATHTFFCLNCTTDPSGQSILPITATSSMADGQQKHFMLLYTCEMILETARPHMQELGAFKALAGSPPTGPPAQAVPAADILASLKAPGAINAGIHINEFVPGLASEYKVLGLSTEAMERLFGAAGKGAEEATKEEVEV